MGKSKTGQVSDELPPQIVVTETKNAQGYTKLPQSRYDKERV